MTVAPKTEHPGWKPEHGLLPCPGSFAEAGNGTEAAETFPDPAPMIINALRSWYAGIRYLEAGQTVHEHRNAAGDAAGALGGGVWCAGPAGTRSDGSAIRVMRFAREALGIEMVGADTARGLAQGAAKIALAGSKGVLMAASAVRGGRRELLAVPPGSRAAARALEIAVLACDTGETGVDVIENPEEGLDAHAVRLLARLILETLRYRRLRPLVVKTQSDLFMIETRTAAAEGMIHADDVTARIVRDSRDDGKAKGWSVLGTVTGKADADDLEAWTESPGRTAEEGYEATLKLQRTLRRAGRGRAQADDDAARAAG